MTCGVYILRFKGTDKVYIGQALDIEDRFRIHRSKLKCGTHAKKLLEAYKFFGYPSLEILLECTPASLDTNENEAIEIFDAVTNGFNTCKTAGGGNDSFGEDVGNSKFSNTQIEQAFLLLVNRPDLLSKDIASITGVSKDTIDAISCYKVHLWLEDKYPENYEILRNRPTSRFGKGKTLKERGILYPDVISPDGVKYQVENTSQFAKDHKLNNGHLVQLLRGKEKQHKGWRLVNGN